MQHASQQGETVTQAQTQTRPDQTRPDQNGNGKFVAAVSTEARPGIFTSEMWMTWLAAIVFVIAAYVSDTFDNDLGWILAAAVFVAYILSRGFAKAGSREGPFFVSGPAAETNART
jgi:hypothetical protein